MFKIILHANDGSEGADKALTLAVGLAKQSGAVLHIVCVEEISEFPETIGEVKNEKRLADRRYRPILRRAEGLAEQQGVKVVTHILTGHPVRTSSSSAENSMPTCWSSAPPATRPSTSGFWAPAPTAW